MNSLLWLKLIRTEKGLTQQEVADMVGITREQYNAYENGRVKPRDVMKHRVSEALDFDIKLWVKEGA